MMSDPSTTTPDPPQVLVAVRDLDLEAPDAGRRRTARLATIAALAICAHAAGLAALAWLERFAALDGQTAGLEIPVEVVGEDEAPRGGAKGEPGKSPPARSASREAQVQEPQQDAGPRPTDGEPIDREKPKGVILERPRETDLPQEARTRGAEKSKRPETTDEQGNPFGGLAPLAAATEQRPPAFIEPRAFLDTRPTPAPDATNDNYRARVLNRVAESMMEPERPRPKALAIVSFRIDDTGALTAAWLARASGYADLDAEAIDMVKRAAPFPAPPAKSDRDFAAAIAFGGE